MYGNLGTSNAQGLMEILTGRVRLPSRFRILEQRRIPSRCANFTDCKYTTCVVCEARYWVVIYIGSTPLQAEGRSGIQENWQMYVRLPRFRFLELNPLVVDVFHGRMDKLCS